MHYEFESVMIQTPKFVKGKVYVLAGSGTWHSNE